MTLATEPSIGDRWRLCPHENVRGAFPARCSDCGQPGELADTREEGLQRCSICRVVKPEYQFRFSRSFTRANHRFSHCRSCESLCRREGLNADAARKRLGVTA